MMNLEIKKWILSTFFGYKGFIIFNRMALKCIFNKTFDKSHAKNCLKVLKNVLVYWGEKPILADIMAV